MASAGGGRAYDHRATVVLPTLNEQEGLARTFDDLPLDLLAHAGFRTRVLVVDGGSTDGTVDVARQRGASVLFQVGHGKGSAVRQALAEAAEHGAEYVTVIDADYTYVADSLLPAFSLLAAGTDLVVGTRRPVYDPLETPRAAVHRVGDALLSLAAARLSRVPFLDICSGLWGVRTDAVRQVKLEAEGFEIEAELFLKMARHGFRVSQVPVTYRPRVGVAKLHSVRDGSRILLTILRASRGLPRVDTSVDLHYVPGPVPIAETRPSQDWIRMVQALCFSVNPPRLSIVADPDRADEARELARRLWAGEIRVNLTLDSAAPRLGPTPGPATADPTPVVRLPALRSHSPAEALAIVRLPQNHAVFYVRPAPGSVAGRSPIDRSGGHRLPRPGDAPPSFVGSLAAAVNGSAEARSNALLYATAGSLGIPLLSSSTEPRPLPARRAHAVRRPATIKS